MQKRKTKAVSRSQLFLYQATIETLSSHKNLLNCEEEIKQLARTITGNVDLEHHLLFLVMTHRSFVTGRYCLTHNHIIDQAVIKKDHRTVLEQISRGKDAFVELRDNPNLTPAEYQEIQNFMREEYNLLRTVLANYQGEKDTGRKLPKPLHLGRAVSPSGEASLCEKSYLNLLALTNNIPGISFDRSISVKDSEDGHLIPMIYLFDVVELLNEISREQPVNYQTKKAFSNKVVQEIRAKFSKEIKMVARYNSWVDSLEHI